MRRLGPRSSPTSTPLPVGPGGSAAGCISAPEGNTTLRSRQASRWITSGMPRAVARRSIPSRPPWWSVCPCDRTTARRSARRGAAARPCCGPPCAETGVVEERRPLTLALDRQQQREAVLGQELGPVGLERPEVDGGPRGDLVARRRGCRPRCRPARSPRPRPRAGAGPVPAMPQARHGRGRRAVVHHMVNSSLDDAFGALASPVRRGIVERLAGSPATVGEATAGLGVSKPAISRHLRVLEDSGPHPPRGRRPHPPPEPRRRAGRRGAGAGSAARAVWQPQVRRHRRLPGGTQMSSATSASSAASTLPARPSSQPGPTPRCCAAGGRPSPDWDTPEAEVDLRVGGGYRLAMRDPGGGDVHVVAGEYTEVVPPERLAHVDLGARLARQRGLDRHCPLPRRRPPDHGPPHPHRLHRARRGRPP